MVAVQFVRCVRCRERVKLDACTTCNPDGPDPSCDECEGAGWTDDGTPFDADDVLCHDCWRATMDDATREWCC